MATFPEKVNNALEKAGLQPVSVKSVMGFYMPLKGSLAYVMLSTQMFTPELYENFRFIVIPQYISLTNACLVNSMLGTGLFIHTRPHLASASPKDKVIFCAFGSVMFNLGSMLLWALGRTVAPESPVLRTVFGTAGAVGALYLGKRYVDFVDSKEKAS